MNRGSIRGDRDSGGRTSRFNEAPIHESGKSRQRRMQREYDRASMRPRFMNRGSTIYLNEGINPPIASMRPRFMNRGSSTVASTRKPTPCSFNEAPIHESGKSSGCRTAPACSRGFNEAPIHESGK